MFSIFRHYWIAKLNKHSKTKESKIAKQILLVLALYHLGGHKCPAR